MHDSPTHAKSLADIQYFILKGLKEVYTSTCIYFYFAPDIRRIILNFAVYNVVSLWFISICLDL